MQQNIQQSAKPKKLNWILKIVNMQQEEEKIDCKSLGKKGSGNIHVNG